MAFYKRSVFLINPAFQLRFSLIICSLIFLSNLVYPVILVDFFDEIILRFPQLGSGVTGTRNELILFLASVQIIFTVMVFVLFIFMTHKIAGPMYKLKSHLMKIREGNPITPVHFRNGDHFQDVADEVNLFLETVLVNQEDDFEYLEEVSAYLDNLVNVIPDDKRPVLNEISRRLLDIKSRYKRNL